MIDTYTDFRKKIKKDQTLEHKIGYNVPIINTYCKQSRAWTCHFTLSVSIWKKKCSEKNPSNREKDLKSTRIEKIFITVTEWEHSYPYGESGSLKTLAQAGNPGPEYCLGASWQPCEICHLLASSSTVPTSWKSHSRIMQFKHICEYIIVDVYLTILI
jgi:hypothetical protein